MGGRGSSGGGGGIGGVSAVNEKMPALTGSEKQVKWADDIRYSMLLAADAVVRNAQRNKSLGIKPSMYYPSLEGAIFARKDVVSTLKTVTNASKIIDARKSLTQHYIEKIGIEYDKKKREK